MPGGCRTRCRCRCPPPLPGLPGPLGPINEIISPLGTSFAIVEDNDLFRVQNTVGIPFSSTAAQAEMQAPNGSSSVLAGASSLTSTVSGGGNTTAVTQSPLSVATTFNATVFSVETVNGLSLGTAAAATATLDVNGTFKYVDGLQSATDVLTSSATGVANWQPIPKGFIWFTDLTTPYSTGPLVLGNPVPLAMINAVGPNTPGFASPAPGQLQYTGPGPRVSNVALALSWGQIHGLTVGETFIFQLTINGAATNYLSFANADTSYSDVRSVAITANFQLFTNDIIAVNVISNSTGSEILIYTFQLVIQ